MQESIGMLSAAYFASRSQILQWLNDLLGLQYTKIEQTASGVAVCQIFDALFPDAVKLDKVNFNARREYEFIQNYKVLQAAFNRVGIQKQVDVERLIKAKYQDNLEFMQWVKGFFDSHASEEALSYDGTTRRAQFAKGSGRTVSRTAAAPRAPVSRSAAAAPRSTVSRSAPAPRPTVPKTGAPRPASGMRRPAGGPTKENRVVNGPPKVLKSEFDAVKAEVAELQASLEEIDAEREFYFNKLRGVEIIVQGVEDANPGQDLDPVLAEIKQTLYQTEAVADPAGEEIAEDAVAEDGDFAREGVEVDAAEYEDELGEEQPLDDGGDDAGVSQAEGTPVL